MRRIFGNRRVVGVPFGIVVMLATAIAASASAEEVCSHDEALAMGATLHEELDVNSARFRDRSLTETEKKANMSAFIDLLDASDLALRGDDTEACRRYREIAERMDIELE